MAELPSRAADTLPLLSRILGRFKPAPEVPLETIVNRVPNLTDKERIFFGGEVREKRLLRGGGENERWLVTLTDSSQGLFKPATGEKNRLRSSVRSGTYFKREYAAHLVDRFIGFDLTPATVIREIDGRLGSLQEFIKIDERGFFDKNEAVVAELRKDLYSLWVFDYLIWNSDRHNFNWVVAENKIVGLDNGLSFGWDTFRSQGDYYKVPAPAQTKEVVTRFAKDELAQEQLRALLGLLLPKSEVKAFSARLKKMETLIGEKGIVGLHNNLYYWAN